MLWKYNILSPFHKQYLIPERQQLSTQIEHIGDILLSKFFFFFLCCYFNLKHILSYSLYIFIYECHMHMHQPEPSVCLSLSDTCTLFHTVCLHLMFLWKEVIPRCFVPRVFSACTATVPFAFKWTSSNIEACSGEVLQSSCVKWWLLGVTLSSLSPFSLFFFVLSISLPPSPGRFPPTLSVSISSDLSGPSLPLAVLLCSLSMHF